MGTKLQTNISSLTSLDIRAGRILKVEDSKTKKPTYRLTVDFGRDVGIKISCGAYRHYRKEDLVGKQVIGLVNLGPKRMGPEISDVLILGVSNAAGETVYLTPQEEVPPGAEVF